MPFGLINTPTIFQSLMNDVFCSCLRKFVLVFFDDILIYSETKEQDQEHLKLVLKALEEQQLFVNIKKCTFGRDQVVYLGHVISGQGVVVGNEKIKAILEWEQPINLKELIGFLGLTDIFANML